MIDHEHRYFAILGSIEGWAGIADAHIGGLALLSLQRHGHCGGYFAACDLAYNQAKEFILPKKQTEPRQTTHNRSGGRDVVA